MKQTMAIFSKYLYEQNRVITLLIHKQWTALFIYDLFLHSLSACSMNIKWQYSWNTFPAQRSSLLEDILCHSFSDPIWGSITFVLLYFSPSVLLISAPNLFHLRNLSKTSLKLFLCVKWNPIMFNAALRLFVVLFSLHSQGPNPLFFLACPSLLLGDWLLMKRLRHLHVHDSEARRGQFL